MSRLPRKGVAIPTAGLLAGLLLLAACSGSAPQVLFPDAQLFLYHDRATGQTSETLRLFVAVQDGDGVEDLQRIFVINDEADLRWESDAEQWVTREYGGDSWVGLPDIRMADHLPLPRGRYRVVVEDGALQSAEASFIVSAPPLPEETEFPLLLGSGNNLQVEFDEPVILRVYARTGQQLLSREVEPGAVDPAVLAELPNESGMTAYLWTRVNQPIRLLVGPYDIER